MITKGQIESFVYFKFKEAQIKALESKREGLFHVTDFARPCMRNTYYSKLNIEKERELSPDSIKHFFMGQAIHQASALSEQNEVKLAYDFVEDKPVDLEKCKAWKITDPRWHNIVIGSIDDIVKFGKDKDGNDVIIICDKKTTAFKGYKMTKPNEGHVEQISIYALLLKKCMNIVSKWGCVIYLDVTDKIAKPLPLSFKIPDLEEVRADLISKGKLVSEALLDKTPIPSRTKNYLCDGYCPYISKCCSDGET